MFITKQFTFSASHQLKDHPGKCRNLHGHTYTLRITVSGDIDPKTGMVIDFNDIKKIVQAKVLDVLDHSHLNDTVEIPTAENMAVWVWEHLKDSLPGLSKVKLWETPSSYVAYNGK